MVSVQAYLLTTNSSFPLRLSEPQGMFNLGQICQNSEAKIKHQPVLCSLIKLPVSANQSARYIKPLL